MKTKFWASLAAAIISPALALAQPNQPLKSFGYESTGCYVINGVPLMTFNGANYQMQAGNPPGSGQFPVGSFWLRAITVTFKSDNPNETVVIGHSGPDGDLVSPFVLSGGAASMAYPADAAPLFTPGEYFDGHTNSDCDGSESLSVIMWFQPALSPQSGPSS